ncbi:unnamed protein product [Allacma fusca]|uniref:RING-type domain-containing protein n=1 Tax=Allacma fusca TaxID=39272 RepID=A0A8J2PNE4_9HEXA|nr:unnamed protein product [Allacma fusca]
MEYTIHQQFPLLNFWNNKTQWMGFMKVQNCFLRLTIDVPNYPRMKCGRVSADKHTSSLLSQLNIQKEIEKLIKTDLTLLEFLESFSSLVVKSAGASSEVTKNSEMWSPDVYLSIINDVESIGLENIPFMSENLQEIHASREDPSGRIHLIKFSVPHGYPDSEVLVKCDIPVTSEEIIWPAKISAACNHFSKLLENFDPFWTEMDEVDAEVQVLDPAKPNRKHVHRRIAIDEQIILQIVVNPLCPRGLPNVQFYGPEEVAGSFEVNFTKNCKKWNSNFSIIENLKAVMSVDFPVRQEGSTENVTCVICYMYELDGDVPETICQCRSFFHNTCIQELYLNEMTNNVMKPNAVDCPVCTMEIKVKEH